MKPTLIAFAVLTGIFATAQDKPEAIAKNNAVATFCGADYAASKHDELVVAFKEQGKRPAVDRVMLYDSRAERMETYPIPAFAQASSATLYRTRQGMRLEVLLKAAPPAKLEGWLSVEAHFSAIGESDHPPIFAYLAGTKTLASVPYLKANGATGLTSSGGRLNGTSGSLTGSKVIMEFESGTVGKRELFAVVVRYLPESFARPGMSGGFNAAVTDLLRGEYMTSLQVPALPAKVSG